VRLSQGIRDAICMVLNVMIVVIIDDAATQIIEQLFQFTALKLLYTGRLCCEGREGDVRYCAIQRDAINHYFNLM
jgi:hypothetical protein